MKTPNRWIFFGAMVAGLMYGPVLLQAQPESDLGSTSDKSASPGAKPPLPSDKPAPADDALPATDDDDEPWSRGVSFESRQAARDLFLAGNRLFGDLQIARAIDQYVAALSKWKHPAFYFNLALAQRYLGAEVQAHESFEHALSYGEPPLGTKRFQQAQKQLEQMNHRLGRIRLVCQTKGAVVTLDGATLFTGPGRYEGWTKAKSHEFTAKKTGYQSEIRQVDVPAGETLSIDLSLITLAQATDISRRWAAWKPWMVVGAGVAVASIGGMFHMLAFKNFNSYDDAFSMQGCALINQCRREDIPSELNKQLSNARREQLVAVSSYLAGGSVIITGLALLYLNRPRWEISESLRAHSIDVSIVPTVSRDILGVAGIVSF